MNTVSSPARDPRPAAESYKEANEKKYLTTQERRKYATQSSKLVKLERFVARCRRIVPKVSGKVLDIGGGGGTWTDVLRNAGLVGEVYAIDISPAILKERDPRDVSVVGDMEHLPFENGFFDAAFFFAALHHVRQTETALSEAHRTVREGGYLLLYEPFSLRMRLTGRGIEPTPDGVEFCYSFPYVCHALGNTGWKIEKVVHEGFLRRFLRGGGSVPVVRALASCEDVINRIPLIRGIAGFFGDNAIIVARRV